MKRKTRIGLGILVVMGSLCLCISQALMGAHTLTIRNETKGFEIKASDFEYTCDLKCRLSVCGKEDEKNPSKFSVIKPGGVVSDHTCYLATRMNLGFTNVETRGVLRGMLSTPGAYVSLNDSDRFELRMDDGEWAYFFEVNVVHHMFGNIEVSVKGISRYKTMSGGLSWGSGSIILMSKEDL